MDVSPKTLREIEFRERLRGYHPDDVDTFLERVAAGIEILQERLRQATDRAVRAEQRTAEVGDGDAALRRTLGLAQRTADLALQEARENAARIVAAAEERAREVLDEVDEAARQRAIAAEAGLRDEIAQLEAARDQLRSDVAAFQRYLDAERSRLRLTLSDAIRWLEEGIPSLAPSPVVHQPAVPDAHEQSCDVDLPAVERQGRGTEDPPRVDGHRGDSDTVRGGSPGGDADGGGTQEPVLASVANGGPPLPDLPPVADAEASGSWRASRSAESATPAGSPIALGPVPFRHRA